MEKTHQEVLASILIARQRRKNLSNDESKWPKYDQASSTQKRDLEKLFSCVSGFFQSRNERQGGGKRTFNVTFAKPYKESVRRTILGMKSEFKSRTRADCLTFERHSPDSVLMFYVRLPE